MVTGMNSGGIDQVIHPQVAEGLPISHGADILTPLPDLIPSGIRLCILASNSWGGRHHGGSSNRLGWILSTQEAFKQALEQFSVEEFHDVLGCMDC